MPRRMAAFLRDLPVPVSGEWVLYGKPDVTSPIGGYGDRDPFYEPYIGKVDVGTLR